MKKRYDESGDGHIWSHQVRYNQRGYNKAHYIKSHKISRQEQLALHAKNSNLYIHPNCARLEKGKTNPITEKRELRETIRENADMDERGCLRCFICGGELSGEEYDDGDQWEQRYRCLRCGDETTICGNEFY